MQLGILLQLLYDHAVMAEGAGWCLPAVGREEQVAAGAATESVGQHGALRLDGVFPYWMEGDHPNTIRNTISLPGMMMLTGPNMAGKLINRPVCKDWGLDTVRLTGCQADSAAKLYAVLDGGRPMVTIAVWHCGYTLSSASIARAGPGSSSMHWFVVGNLMPILYWSTSGQSKSMYWIQPLLARYSKHSDHYLLALAFCQRVVGVRCHFTS